MNQYNLAGIDELEEMQISKAEFFEGLQIDYDFALPQNWLNAFSDWCAKNCPDVSYSMIRSTTVWGYPERDCDSFLPGPIFACSEVFDAFRLYDLSIDS